MSPIYARNVIPGDYQNGSGALVSLEPHGDFVLLIYRSASRKAQLLAWWPALMSAAAIEDAVSVVRQLTDAAASGSVDTLDALIAALAVSIATKISAALSQQIAAQAA